MPDPKIVLDVYNLKKDEAAPVETAPTVFIIDGFKQSNHQTGAR